MSNRDVIILSTADWDNPFWTNKQHVASQLASRGHRVLYIESLGLRRPSASKADLKRILFRAWKGVRPPRNVSTNLWVWSPVVLPFHGNPVVRLINRVSLRLGLSFWSTIRNISVSRAIFWTYSPLTTSFFDLSSFSSVVYHCVDEVKAQPGMPVGEIERRELELVRSSDVVFVTSRSLERSRLIENRNTYYFSNVADYDHFSRARLASTIVPPDIKGVGRPVIGFVGAISGYKMDFGLVAEVARLQPDWSFVLIGKVGEGDPWTDVSALKGLPNVHLIGPKPYRELPAYMKGMDVAMLPCAINEYTAGMFPMKFFEYLSAGLPVVSTPLEALSEYSDVVRFAADPISFVRAIEGCLTERLNSDFERRVEGVARQHTYEVRMDRMMERFHSVVGGGTEVS